MIKLCEYSEIEIDVQNVELFKIKCSSKAYPDEAFVWQQSEEGAIIGMLDANMFIHATPSADYEELKGFLNMSCPQSVFSSVETLEKLGLSGFERAKVYVKKQDSFCDIESDDLSSKELYALMNVEGLDLPQYEYFAVDFCHRLNYGFAHYFALKDKCAAITFNVDDYCLVNGVASHQKGMGSLALNGVLSQNNGKTAFCVCKAETGGFYEKNGFEYLYDVGYWRKNG